MRRVRVTKLKEGMVLARPVYSASGAMLIPAGTKVASYHMQNLMSRGVTEVWIEDKRMDGVEIEDAVSETLKIKMLQTIRALYQKAAKEKETKNVRIPDAVISGIVSDLADEITASKGKVLNISSPATGDSYLPVHTMNVAIISLTIGRQYGLNDMQLFDLGTGSLLYDIGMAFLPDNFPIGNPDLTTQEFEILKKHTIDGFEVLQKNGTIPATAQSIALQHHEKYDGTGYPKGLSKDQIHLYAKIVAIADVYDSLLSDRPSRQRFQPHEAYEYVMTAGGFDFDLELIQAFTMCVAPYPVGTMVRLSTGEKGVISKVTWGLATRPVIRLFYDARGNNLDRKIDIDLADKPSILVEEIIEI